MRSCRLTSGQTLRLVPGHALHEKGLQLQKGVVPLVGSQEQRALLVPVINRFPDILGMRRVCKDKKARDLLVGIQERRALFVPVINR